MFDTMTMTKFVGGFGGALLVFLLLNMAGGSLFRIEPERGEEHQQAYAVDTGDAGSEAKTQTAQEAPDFNAVLASANAAKGEKTFGKCKACHKLDQNATGPHLGGVVGRDIASVTDYSYSSALQGLGGKWTPDRLNQFLTKPKTYAPGTKMTFSGLKKITDRANVVAFLQSTAE